MQTNNMMERIIPDELNDSFSRASLQLHLERYNFAGENFKAGRVLDIACGTGYGSYLLAGKYQNSISEIVAVDISEESIAYARKRYAHPKIKFMVQDAFAFSDHDKFNSIISLETIEHLHNPFSFVSHLYGMLRPGGILVASAPVTPSTDINSYHVNDFSQNSFRSLFSKLSLSEKSVLHQVQQVKLKDIMNTKKSNRTEGIRKNLLGYYFSHPDILLARARSLISDGFSNKYMTLALQNKDQ